MIVLLPELVVFIVWILFAGSHRAAQNAAMLYSFLGTCKINNVNPQDWMTDVLTRIPAHPVNKLQELLPHKWKPITSPQTQNSQEKR